MESALGLRQEQAKKELKEQIRLQDIMTEILELKKEIWTISLELKKVNEKIEGIKPEVRKRQIIGSGYSQY